jgi:hypothetical protein
MFVTHASVGSTYKYSGTARPCHVVQGGHNDDHSQEEPHPEQQFLLDLCQVCNVLYQKLVQEGLVCATDDGVGLVDMPSSCADPADHHHPYNCCLVNWYQPHHHIGLHADDEKELNPSIPIVSLSWGGPRRFLLRPKASLDKNKLSKLWHKSNNSNNNNSLAYFEIELKDGDLLFMGGNCQQEFKHEIPKVRKTKDGLVGPRISWTLRSMIPPSRPLPQHAATGTRTAQSSLSKMVLASKAPSLGKRNHRDHEQSLQERVDHALEEQEEEVAIAMGDDRRIATTQRRRIEYSYDSVIDPHVNQVK